MPETEPNERCRVCDEVLDPRASADCYRCGARFHLVLTQGEGRDCGQVWLDEAILALQFACDGCLLPEEREQREAGRKTAPAAEPPPPAAGAKSARSGRMRRASGSSSARDILRRLRP